MKTIGIFMAGQQGDQISALSVMKYRDELWGDCKIVWYSDKSNFDNFKFQDIEVREFPRGFGYPEMVEAENKKLIAEGKEPIWEDWLPLVDWDNRMNVALKHKFPSLEDIDIGYFPAPHQVSVSNRHGIEYANVSKKIFKIPDSYVWHPVLKFSDEEREEVKEFMYEMPHVKTIAIESFAGSSQSKIDGVQISNAMVICRQILGDCNFIFMSHKYLNGDEKFPDGWINGTDIFSASRFTVRQCALIVEQCDLLISVSSGISVASSAWGLKTPLTLQFCGSKICSTAALNTGRRFELVTTDDKSLRDAVLEFEIKLTNLLKQIL